MNDRGYSTVMDAIIFLALVSVCALILSPAIADSQRQRGVAAESSRGLASSTLISLETVRLDFFEYRILGDVSDSIARAGGIDPGSSLYLNTSRLLLGRGSRHKTAMDIAAENAACQLILRLLDGETRLNLLTMDYDIETKSRLNTYVRFWLDSRYSYELRIRWSPLTGVPLEGCISCGETAPPGAVSVTTSVAMPYMAPLDRDKTRSLVYAELEKINESVMAFKQDGLDRQLKSEIRAAMEKALDNLSVIWATDLWDSTVGYTIQPGDQHDPLRLLRSISGGSGEGNYSIGTTLAKQALVTMIKTYNAPFLDSLAAGIASGIEEGTLDEKGAEAMAIEWLMSRYTPSRATASMAIWM